jgi:crossover junction endodeoxyribonuclease RuvC
MRIVGIDPGVHGAFCFLNATGDIEHCDDFATVGDGKRAMLSGAVFADLVRTHEPAVAIVERVGAMPGQGVSSMYRFGFACGIIQGVLAAENIAIQYVVPGVWKRHFGLGSDKDGSRVRAVERWPSHASIFARKKDHGRAEAALLAAWGRAAARAAGEGE